MKRQPMEWEKIFANDATNKGSISKIYKLLTLLKKKKLIKKWAEDLNRHFSKEDMQMTTDTWNDAQHDYLLEKCKSMRYHFLPVRMTIIRKSKNNKGWREYGKKGTLPHC